MGRRCEARGGVHVHWEPAAQQTPVVQRRDKCNMCAQRRAGVVAQPANANGVQRQGNACAGNRVTYASVAIRFNARLQRGRQGMVVAVGSKCGVGDGVVGWCSSPGRHGGGRFPAVLKVLPENVRAPAPQGMRSACSMGKGTIRGAWNVANRSVNRYASAGSMSHSRSEGALNGRK